jgi:hypothetical protein
MEVTTILVNASSNWGAGISPDSLVKATPEFFMKMPHRENL